MGLIKNAIETIKNAGNSASGGLLGGFGGVMNQAMFQEYLASGSMADDILMKRAEFVRPNGSANTKSDANVISSGSVIDVQPNQCMIIVENGKIADACMEPGRYTYNSDLAPSFLAGEGKFLERLKKSAVEMWEQAKMGGQRRNTQRVYFINMGILDKAIYWGVGNVQFKHTQQFVTNAAPYIIGVRVKGNGMAKVRIQRPLEFFEAYGAKYIGGDNAAIVSIDSLEEFFKSCKSSMIQALTGAITNLGSKQAMSYEDITMSENLEKIATSVNEAMINTDIGRMGFDFYQFSVNELVIRDEDLQKIQDAQQKAYDVGNVNLMNYNIQLGQVEAMKAAGENGGVSGFGMLGMMGGGMMGGNFGNIQAQPNQQFAPQQPAEPIAPANTWKCPCGNDVDGNFCPICGKKKPEPKPADSWTCSCGAVATGKFCPECGQKRLDLTSNGWSCICGHVNQGKFCQECGAKKPADAPLYRCDKCGWQPEDPKNPPKFCPECGDRFDESDAQ